jgi:hypothetical protein
LDEKTFTWLKNEKMKKTKNLEIQKTKFYKITHGKFGLVSNIFTRFKKVKKCYNFYIFFFNLKKKGPYWNLLGPLSWASTKPHKGPKPIELGKFSLGSSKLQMC